MRPVSSAITDDEMRSPKSACTEIIRKAALRHGFLGAGISRAEFMEEEAGRLEEWLGRSHHGEMGYMANHFDLRVDPTRLVPGAKSVVSLMFNYYPGGQAENQAEAKAEAEDDHTRRSKHHRRSPITDHSIADQGEAEALRIARYALGEDYHKVLRRKLKTMISEIKQEIGDFHARVFVDSAPVLERDWAKRSGVGWIGKNTLLIHPKKGSFFFLAEIILDVELEYDHPMRDHCGTCTRCIDACPTEAISPQGYVMDGSKCISYLTIELKSAIPQEFKSKMEGWIFGCDICQEVCPWNRFSVPHDEPAFKPVTGVQQMSERDWIEMTEDVFGEKFGKTPLKRAGLEKIKDTVRFVGKGN